MVIAEILSQKASQMPIVYDDDMIETLTSNATDHALHVAILPSAFRCNPYLLNARPFDSRSEMLALNSVTIPNHVPRCGIFRERLDNLLCRPHCRGMLRDIEMEDTSTIMRENNKNVQNAQLNRRSNKRFP